MTYMTLIYCISYEIINTKSWDSSVSAGTRLQAGWPGLCNSVPRKGTGFSNQQPDYLCSLPCLLPNGYQRIFPWG